MTPPGSTPVAMTTQTSFGSTSLTSQHSSASSPVFTNQLKSSSLPSPSSLSSSSSPSSGAATSSSSSLVPLSPPSFTTLLPMASVLASSPTSPVTSQLLFLSTSSSSAAAAAPATSPSLLSSSSSSLSPTSLSSPSSSTSEIKKKLQLRVMAKRSQEAILNSSASSSSSFSLTSSSSSSSSSSTSSSAFPLLSSSSSSAFLRGTGQQKSPSSENQPFATTTTTVITSSTKQKDNSCEATKTTVISQALLTQIQLYLQLKKLLQQKQQQHQLSQHFQQLLQLQQDLQTANGSPSQKQPVVNSIRPVVMTTKPVVKPGPGNANFGDNKITVSTGYPLSANSSAQVCNLLLAEKLRNLEQEILEKKKLLLSVRPQAINFMTLPTTSSMSVSTTGQLPSTEPLVTSNTANLAGQNAALNSTHLASNSVNTASKNFLFGATTPPSKPADCQSTNGEVVSFYSNFPSGTFNSNNNSNSSSNNNNNNNGNMECDDFMSTDVSDTQVNTVSSELSFDHMQNSDYCDILCKESTKKRRKSSTSENSSSLPKKQKSVKTTGAMVFKSCATPQSTNFSAPTAIQTVASCSIATNSCSSSKTPEGTNTLENLKVFELKVECRKRHLSVSGNKQSLLLRLLPFSDAILQQQQQQQSQVSGQTTDSEASLSCGSSSDGLGASQSAGELNVGRQVLSGLEPKISDVPSFGNALVKSTITRKSVVPLANKIVSSAPNSQNVSTLDAIVKLSSTFDANNYFNNKAIKSTGDHSQVKILGDLAAASTQSVENTTANLEIEKILSSRQICQLLWEKQQRELLKVHLELMDMERRLTTARGHVFNKTSQQSSKTNVLNGNKIVIGNQPEQQNLAAKLIRDSIQKSLKQASNPGQLLNITTLLNSLSANQQPKISSFVNNDPFQGTDQILTGNNSCLLPTSEEIPGFDVKGSLFSDGLSSQKNKDSILIDDAMNGDHDTDEQNFQSFDAFNCCDEEEDEDGEREMDDVSEGFCAEDLETDDQHPPPPQYHEAVLLKKIQALAEMARNSGQLPPYTPPEQSTPVFLPNFQSPTNHVPFATYMDDDIYMLALNESSNKTQVSIADKCLGSNLTDATVLMSGANSVNGVLAGSNASTQERAFCSALQPINPIFNNLGISEITKSSSQTLQSTVDCFFSPPMPNLGGSTPDGGQSKTSSYQQNQDEDELWFQDQWFDSWGVNEECLTGVENKEPAPLLSPKSSSSSSSSSSSLFFDAFVDGQDLFNRPLTNLVKH